MRKLLGILVGLAFLLSTTFALAAGTITYTEKKLPNNVWVITFTCTGDGSGGSYPSDVSNAMDIEGYVFLVITNPGSTGPTDDYDIVLNDADGVDIMGGQLEDRDESNSEQAVPYIDGVRGSRYVHGVLTPVITNNSVNSAVTVITIYFYR